MGSTLHDVARYGLALVAVVLVHALLATVIEPLMGGARAPLTFLLATALAAAYGGVGPGLVATALAGALVATTAVTGTPIEGTPVPDLVRAALLLVLGIVIAFLFGRVRTLREREAAAVARLDRELQSRRTAERALLASRQQFETMAAAVPDILFSATARGGIEYLNPRWSEVTGLTTTLCLGTGWRAAVHAEDLPAVDAAIAAAQRGAAPYELRLRLRSASGVFRMFLLRALPVHDAPGDTVRWFGAMTDLDDLEQARAALLASEERLQTALEAADMGTFSLDLDSGATFLSPRAMSLLGTDHAAALLETFRGRARPGDWWRLKRAFVVARGRAGAAEGSRARFREHVRLGGPRGERHLLVAGALLFAGGAVRRVAGTLLDETAMRAGAARVAHAQAGLQLAVAATQLGTWDYDVAQAQLTLSPRARAIYGLPPHADESTAALRAALEERLHPDDRARVLQGARAAIAAGGAGRFEIEHRLRLPDGSVRWVVTSGQAVFDTPHETGRAAPGAASRSTAQSTPRLTRVSGTLLDVTERRRALEALHASEERFRLAAEALDGLIYDCDLATGAVERSRGLFELLGWRPDEVPANASWWQAQVHADDLAVTQATFDRVVAQRGSHVETEYRVRHRDGRWRMVADRAMVVYGPDGTAARLIGCTIDITAQRAGEDALRAADESKNRFLAQLAHELRTPLAPMRNAVALLRGGAEPAQRARHLDVLERQLAHAARLVDDLLDISRIASHKLELQREPALLADVVRAAVETVQPLADERHQHLDVGVDDDGRRAWLDPVRITQVITNLLTNAVKFTPTGGRIELAARIDAERIVVRVSDTGVGIPHDGLERIFAMFSQLDVPAAATGTGGLGIGLALSRSLVALHGGTLAARSEGPGRGAVFEFELPFVPAEITRAPDAGETPPLEAQRILVADDNVDSAESLAALLAIGGHRVFVAHDGAAAVRMARAVQPTLAILDLGMPILDGYAAAREIRGGAGGQAITLVALSGFGQPADRERSRDAGFDMHLVKPIDPGRIDTLLAQALARRASLHA